MVETVRFELTSPGLKVRYAAVALRIHKTKWKRQRGLNPHFRLERPVSFAC